MIYTMFLYLEYHFYKSNYVPQINTSDDDFYRQCPRASSFKR